MLITYGQERWNKDRLDARLKLVLTLGAVLGINLTPLHAWPVFVAYLVGVLAVAEVARVGGVCAP